MPLILVRLVFHPGRYRETSKNVRGGSAARNVVGCALVFGTATESVPP